MFRNPLQILTVGLIALIIVSAATAVAAANTIPPTNVTQQDFPITANDLRPPACAGLFLNDIISGSGNFSGTAGNDLIIGSSGDDTINGMGGNDCIVGGGGNDTIDGGDGSDICIGGPGNNSFVNCEGEY